MSQQHYSDNELYEAVLILLTKNFGHADTLRFLSLNQMQNRDYLQIREQLFKNMDVKTLYENATQYWENTTKHDSELINR